MNYESLQKILQKYNVSEEIQREIQDFFTLQSSAGPTQTNTQSSSPTQSTSQTLFLDDEEESWFVQESEESYESRYEDLGLLGVGGMGEVRKVKDLLFNRILAMKIIHPEIQRFSSGVARFMEEAQIVAQLQHPGIVPVFDRGTLPDGRLFFTMIEIKGVEFSNLLQKYHTIRETQEEKAPPMLRRLLNIFHKVCETMSYAHESGIIHRDLKPENIMIGAHGEVLVVDWGIAKILNKTERALPNQEITRVSGSFHTKIGQVTGTPAYMSPEQAAGRTNELDQRSDIYTLGTILFEILTGKTPQDGKRPYHSRDTTRISSNEVLLDTQTLLSSYQNEIPPELYQACVRCMQTDPNDRFQSATTLADYIRDFLDGAQKRDQALQILDKAHRAKIQSQRLQQRSKVLKEQSEATLQDLASWDPEEQKWTAWEQEEQSQTLALEAELKKVENQTLLYASLSHYSELAEAHNSLIWQFKKEHIEAEKKRDASAAVQLETLLRHHIDSLPGNHVHRHEHIQYLKGLGGLTLHTDPPNASVFIETYKSSRRRQVLTNKQFLGKTPLDKVPLPMGSYRLRICKEGYRDVLYPIRLNRLEHWDGIPPEASDTSPIPLIRNADLDENEVYVPQGYFLCGGDNKAYHALTKERVWMDGFIIRRFPVTNAEFILFLNFLHKGGQTEMAHRLAPRLLGGSSPQTLAYHFTDHFFLPETDAKVTWKADWPVFMLTWNACNAYAHWRAEQEQRPWRLPFDKEWEKAAKGTDGRWYPWGDGFDPSFCSMELSYPEATPTSIHSFPLDESPYGVRGMAGNVRDWIGGDRIQGVYQVVRGGCWSRDSRHCRSSNRLFDDPNDRYDRTGFRLLRPLQSDKDSS
ncbi:MAG: SUMF1/EgtB/PvdO family nonheme iron enzyme [Myxococcota bacterium]|nr:SUMF1/EgtB/PvdO family nonheme iron enzyme [Myxococcota bacterium]